MCLIQLRTPLHHINLLNQLSAKEITNILENSTNILESDFDQLVLFNSQINTATM
eukprot:Pgem_evm1s15611